MNHSYSNLAKVILDRMEFYRLLPELLNNIYYAHLSGGQSLSSYMTFTLFQQMQTHSERML